MNRNSKGQFAKGHASWNKGLRGFKHSGSFQKGHSLYGGAEKGWFKKGEPGFWLGKKRASYSKKWRDNMSKATKGKFRGNKNPNWKGGRKRGHYTDANYRDWRGLIFKRDDYTCWICEERGKTLQSHHLKDWFAAPELRYDPVNGLTLCVFCHKTYTKYGNKK